MRILHILDHSIPLHSGYTFRTRAIIEQQRAMGWETFHLTSPKQGRITAPVEQYADLAFHRTKPSRGFVTHLPVINQLDVVFRLARRLSAVIDTVKPDVLHAHSPALNGLAALHAARHSGLPLVYEVRAFWEDAAVDHGTGREGGLRYRITRRLETHVLQRADAVTTICAGLRDDIVARGVPAHKVTVIPNAVDIGRFTVGGSPDPARRTQLGLDGKTVLGFIGSFYAYEGLSLLLEALPAVHSRAPDTCLLLVGGGPDEARLKQLVAAYGLQDCVIFTGRVPHDEVQAYYDLIDILVYPRLRMRLTELVTPLKPLEAMAQGRLLVASDVGGHRELIRPGETGQLFQAGNAAALECAILDMLRDRSRWPAMRDAGRRFVESERTWEISVAGYAQVYAAVLDRDKRNG